MHLYLSTGSPWNATYSNAEGQVVYKAEFPEKPFSLRLPPITIVKRVLPSNVANTDNVAALPDSFSPLAEIDYRVSTFLTPHIRYNGIDIDTGEFFRKAGLFWR